MNHQGSEQMPGVTNMDLKAIFLVAFYNSYEVSLENMLLDQLIIP